MKRLSGLLFFILFCCTAFAQETIVTGKVTDARTGEAVPFANVFFKGTTIGVNTDFDGNYRIRTSQKADSITVTFIGYKPRTKKVKAGVTQIIHFQMEEDGYLLNEVVVKPGENPALKIMRQVLDHKSTNNPDRLLAYNCETFNRIEISVDNISEKMKNKKIFRSIRELMDSVIKLSGEDGKPLLPVFVSETVSDFYFANSPKRIKEYIRATHLSGVGIEDGSLVSQLLGSTFQQYNFYENWNRILDKDFVSPLANSGNMYYIYTLRDTMWIDNHWCYEIQVNPKRKEDLAFTGTIWVADTSFALKRVVLEIGKGANLNFIEKIKIQQELMPTVEGPWVQSKARILVDVAQVSKTTAGMLARFYSSHKNYVFNQPKPARFYDQKIEVDEEAQNFTDSYWATARHDSLTQEEKYVYSMVDSVKKVPALKTLAELADIAVNGYYSFNKIDAGPYIYILGYNMVEGFRFRAGGKTNANFSRKYVMKGYVAYGEQDNRFKYSGQFEYIMSRKPWTKLVVYRKQDLNPLAIVDKPDASGDNLFNAVSTITGIRRFGWTEDNRVWLERSLNKNFSQKIIVQNTSFAPEGDFNFAYYRTPETPGTSSIHTNYTLNFVTLETRFAYGETFLQNDNERISLGVDRGPEVTVSWSYGNRSIAGGDFDMNRLSVDVEQKLGLGVLGNAKYTVHAANYFSRLPYPALEIHRGNQSLLYNSQTFNLMRFFEFVSDHYVAATYEHYFEGLITNRVPLVRRLKWRTFANSKILWGGMRQENIDLLPASLFSDPKKVAFYTLESKPYWEVGYGVENIFRLLRVDFVHRLSYLNHPQVGKFGVKLSLQFKL